MNILCQKSDHHYGFIFFNHNAWLNLIPFSVFTFMAKKYTKNSSFLQFLAKCRQILKTIIKYLLNFPKKRATDYNLSKKPEKFSRSFCKHKFCFFFHFIVEFFSYSSWMNDFWDAHGTACLVCWQFNRSLDHATKKRKFFFRFVFLPSFQLFVLFLDVFLWGNINFAWRLKGCLLCDLIFI